MLEDFGSERINRTYGMIRSAALGLRKFVQSLVEIAVVAMQLDNLLGSASNARHEWHGGGVESGGSSDVSS